MDGWALNYILVSQRGHFQLQAIHCETSGCCFAKPLQRPKWSRAKTPWAHQKHVEQIHQQVQRQHQPTSTSTNININQHQHNQHPVSVVQHGSMILWPLVWSGMTIGPLSLFQKKHDPIFCRLSRTNNVFQTDRGHAGRNFEKGVHKGCVSWLD